MKISEIANNPAREIWDVDYMSTSDEEDNDSDDPDSDLEEQVDSDGEAIPEAKKPAKGKRREKHDVVRTLIERDDDLLTRDLQARLWKIQNWKRARKRFGFMSDSYDGEENFSAWLDYDNDGDVYYAMGTKFKTCYKKGDQLFNCYGLRTNRFLLLNYGFALRNNKYNSLGFKVFVNYQPKEKAQSGAVLSEENNESRFQKIIRLKRDKLCEDLLQYLRANLIFTYKGPNKERLLVSCPVDLDFELFVVACGLNLMRNMMNNKYDTTLEQDRRLLAQIQDNWRFKLGLIHRITQKEILNDQVSLLSILLRILCRIKEGMPYKLAYCLRVNADP